MQRLLILSLITLLLLTGCQVKPEDGIIHLQEPKGIIKIHIDTLNQELPDSKDDGKLPVKFKVENGKERFESYGNIRVQGTSTAGWPKKNWRLRFFEDEAMENKIKLQIGNSIPTDKWIAKAEWIDPSMLRNAVSFRLWESMVESRETTPKYEVDNAFDNITRDKATGAQGFPKTYPAQVLVNGEHYGLSILLLGHDPDNFNIDTNNPNHLYMEFDARGGDESIGGWQKFKVDGIGEWINAYYPKNEELSSEQLQAIDRLSNFINSDIDTFKNNFDKHFDKTNMIDMLLFMEMIYDWDGQYQDVEIVSYDLEKWFFLPWDKDTTFGIFWDGSGILDGSEEKLLFDYEQANPNQLPWVKTYLSYPEEVKIRYAELRDKGVFSTDNLDQIINSIRGSMTEQMWNEEHNRWPDRPSVNELTEAQFRDWFKTRLDVLDQHFDYN